jgi:hypothetical protein
MTEMDTSLEAMRRDLERALHVADRMDETHLAVLIDTALAAVIDSIALAGGGL